MGAPVDGLLKILNKIQNTRYLEMLPSATGEKPSEKKLNKRKEKML